MKNFYLNLKTSEKINFLFSIFNFIWLLILLFVINITYFFIWYWDQKTESWYDMNINYNNYIDKQINTNLEAFKEYILQKDTLIIDKKWEVICSKWVEKKIHNNIEDIKDKFFYISDDKIYIIYSKNYNGIWEVKVFFDTTPYVNSQIIIIKISLFLIILSIFIFYFIGSKITKYSLKNLNKITQKAQELDIEKDFEKLEIIWNKNDEINILAIKINESFCHIKYQTNNLKQFITDVSHEFKTPLMIINSDIDLYNKKIEKNKLNPNDTKNLILSIKEKTKDLNSLLETFLLLSRIENKLEKLEKTKVNFSIYLKDTSKKYIENNKIIQNIWYKNYEIIYNLEDNINLKIEYNTFNLILLNIISNAIKFSQNNKKIILEIWLNKQCFYIRDNWIWIERENLENIFNKFFRNDKNVEWFWIWLFLVKRLVELYNWEIDIETEIWKWTKFSINF